MLYQYVTHKTVRSLCIMVLGVFLIVLSRVVPHPPNATATTAIGMFSARYLGPKSAIAVIATAMIMGDILLGFYEPVIMLSVYGAFIVASLIGLFLPKNHGIMLPVMASMAGSLIFFLVTNAAVWAFSGMYPATLGGLITAYFLGLPFYGYMLVGDAVYAGITFGAASLLTSEDKAYAVRDVARSSS